MKLTIKKSNEIMKRAGLPEIIKIKNAIRPYAVYVNGSLDNNTFSLLEMLSRYNLKG